MEQVSAKIRRQEHRIMRFERGNLRLAMGDDALIREACPMRQQPHMRHD
jgi:hypothetical protein